MIESAVLFPITARERILDLPSWPSWIRRHFSLRHSKCCSIRPLLKSARHHFKCDHSHRTRTRPSRRERRKRCPKTNTHTSRNLYTQTAADIAKDVQPAPVLETSRLHFAVSEVAPRYTRENCTGTRQRFRATAQNTRRTTSTTSISSVCPVHLQWTYAKADLAAESVIRPRSHHLRFLLIPAWSLDRNKSILFIMMMARLLLAMFTWYLPTATKMMAIFDSPGLEARSIQSWVSFNRPPHLPKEMLRMLLNVSLPKAVAVRHPAWCLLDRPWMRRRPGRAWNACPQSTPSKKVSRKPGRTNHITRRASLASDHIFLQRSLSGMVLRIASPHRKVSGQSTRTSFSSTFPTWPSSNGGTSSLTSRT